MWVKGEEIRIREESDRSTTGSVCAIRANAVGAMEEVPTLSPTDLNDVKSIEEALVEIDPEHSCNMPLFEAERSRSNGSRDFYDEDLGCGCIDGKLRLAEWNAKVIMADVNKWHRLVKPTYAQELVHRMQRVTIDLPEALARKQL